MLTDRIGLFEQTVGGLDAILGDVERDLKRILALADERAEEALAEYERRLETRVSDARRRSAGWPTSSWIRARSGRTRCKGCSTGRAFFEGRSQSVRARRA